MHSVIDKHIDRACNTGNQDDYAALFQLMKKTEVYFSISDNGEIQLHENTKITGDVPGLVCYSSPENKRLNNSYSKMIWEDALAMLINFPQEIMLILQSDSDAWIGVSQDTASTLLTEDIDNSDLEALLEQANTTQKDEDYYHFFRAAYNRYVFFPVEDDENRSIKIATTPNDLKVIVFFLKPSDEYSCNAAVWQDGLNFLIDNADIDGLIVQSESEENIAVSREKVEQLLKTYEEWNNRSA